MCVPVDNMAVDNKVAAERTKVESVELVLPPHTNHQVSLCPFLFFSNYPRKELNQHIPSLLYLGL